MTDKKRMIAAFKQVQAMGFVKSHRANNTGIGKTFEDLVGVVENNINEPDLFGYEIKSHRKAASSYITLFTKKPTAPNGANAMLKDKFGKQDLPHSIHKILHASIFANEDTTVYNTYLFRLVNHAAEQRVCIEVRDIQTGSLLNEEVYYSYEDIQQALDNKLKALFFVTADTRKTAEGEEFAFTGAQIYTKPTFRRFIELMNEGKIMYDIRIGYYKSGTAKGKTHDHGSGFRIREVDLIQLYEGKEIVK